MRIGLMVEGQNGLTWERWLHILQLAERLNFPSVFRSDHYFIGPQQDSLEAFLSFAVAAREFSTIRFGPLVSPVTFRSPVDVGRVGAQSTSSPVAASSWVSARAGTNPSIAPTASTSRP